MGPLLFHFSVGDSLGGEADAPVYLLMARWFSGDHSAPVELMMEQALFPPFYPFLLALVGAADSIAYAHRVTVIALLFSSVLFALWLRQQAVRPSVQAGMALLWLLLPSTWMISFELMSEPLYLLLSLVTLLLFKPFASRALGYRFVIIIPLALLLLTRTLGISLILAMLMVLLKLRYWKGIGLLSLSLLPVGAWYGYKALLGFHGNYQMGFLINATDVQQLILHHWGKVNTNLLAMVSSLSDLFALNAHWAQQGCALLICTAACVGWLKRLYAWKVDALYLFIYMGIVLIWPFPDHIERFIWPLLPLLFYYALSLVPIQRQALCVLSLLLLLMPSYFYIGQRWLEGGQLLASEVEFTQTKRWYSRSDLASAQRDLRVRRSLAQLMTQVAQWVPEDECIYFIRPPDLMLLSRRLSFEPPTRHQGALEGGRCPWFLVTVLSHPSAPGPLYPLPYLEPRHIRAFYTHQHKEAEERAERPSPIYSLLVEYRP